MSCEANHEIKGEKLLQVDAHRHDVTTNTEIKYFG